MISNKYMKKAVPLAIGLCLSLPSVTHASNAVSIYDMGLATNVDRGYVHKSNYNLKVRDNLTSPFAYYEDLVSLNQTSRLEADLLAAIREYRVRAFDDNVIIDGIPVRDFLALTYPKFASDPNKLLGKYLDIQVTDDLISLQQAYENLINFRSKNLSYINKGFHPDGSINELISIKSDGRYKTFDDVLVLYNTNNNLNPRVFINHFMEVSGKSDVALSPYDKIKNGIVDPYTDKAETILSPYVTIFDIAHITTYQDNIMQLKGYSSQKLIDTNKTDLNMSGLSGVYKFYFGDPNYKNEKLSEVDRNKLAKATFKTIVKTNSAKTLISSTPRTIKSIQKQLTQTVNTSEKVINDSLSYILGRPVVTEADYNEAIVEVFRIRYGKKLVDEHQQTLALNAFENIVKVESAKTLIDSTPQTIKPIRASLEQIILQSEGYIQELIKLLD